MMPDFDFEMPGTENLDFSDSFSFNFADPVEERYMKPPYTRPIPVKYEYAAQLARQLKIEKDCSYFALLSGNFILGDIFEALAIEQQIQFQRLDISTLSLSYDNVDSLRNLQLHNYVKHINLIISDYFYAHERRETVKYIYQELDKNDSFQLAVAGIHTKITSFTTRNGLKVVIHGSGNLRSSRNVEQISIHENDQLYDFVTDYNDRIITKYATIRKGIRAQNLWEVLK